MPHDVSGQLKLTVSALDAADNVVKELVLDEVPVTVNTISEYTGSLFTSSGGDDKEDGGSEASGFTLMVEEKWETVNSYSF